MEQPITSGSLRRRPGEALAKAAKGERFLILRHGHPVAILRPADGDERLPWRNATMLWRNMRDLLAEARTRRVLITWHGGGAAVLEPLPPEYGPEDPT